MSLSDRDDGTHPLDAGAQLESAGEGAGGVTARAVVTGLALVALIAPAAFYIFLMWMPPAVPAIVPTGVPPTLALSLVLFLTALAGVPGVRALALSRRELLTIYAIVLIGAPMVTPGILYFILPKVVSYYYFAHAHQEWTTGVLPYVPTWFGPSDPAAVDGFFLGRVPVPWGEWQVPLIAWGSFMVALFVAGMCLMSLLKRQWVLNERLTFPIAQIPLEMVQRRGTGGKPVGRLNPAPVFWLGLGLAFLLSFTNTLSAKVPWVPSVPLWATLMQWHPTGPLAGVGAVQVALPPWLIGLAFLLPKELSFSCWFFWFVRVGLHVLAVTLGAPPQAPEDWWDATFPAPYYQGTGALLAFGLWSLWIGRRHLAFALKQVTASRADRADEREPLSYRLAVAGLVVSTVWMVAFLWLAGCRVTVGIVLIAITLGYHMMWARLRAETGLGFLSMPREPNVLLFGLFGDSAFRPAEIATVYSIHWAFWPGEGSSFDTYAGHVMDVFKIADASGTQPRRLASAILASFLFSLVVGICVCMTLTYRYGYLNVCGGVYHWAEMFHRYDGSGIYERIAHPHPPDRAGLAATVMGAIVVVALGMMRLLFHWWPLHPIGYLAANCWGWSYYWLPFALSWAAKTLVIRYGGLRLYRKAVPFAIGLIIGEGLSGTLWAVVELLARGRL